VPFFESFSAVFRKVSDKFGLGIRMMSKPSMLSVFGIWYLGCFFLCCLTKFVSFFGRDFASPGIIVIVF